MMGTMASCTWTPGLKRRTWQEAEHVGFIQKCPKVSENARLICGQPVHSLKSTCVA